MEAHDDPGRTAGHGLDRRTAVACRRELRHVGSGGGSDILARDVGGRERLAHDSGVDEHDVDAVLA